METEIIKGNPLLTIGYLTNQKLTHRLKYHPTTEIH